MLALLWWLQRRFARSAARRRDGETIRVLGRQGLGSKAQLVVVGTADARYVLGVTEHGVSVIDRLPADRPATAPDAAPAATADDFDALLRSVAAQEAPRPAPALRVRHRSDPLRGSILSPQTWRQAAVALRRDR